MPFRRAAVVLLLLLVAPRAGSADWRLFLPTSTGNGVALDLFGSRESDAARTGNRSTSWNDRFFKEKLTLFSNGYVYHPRFLGYYASVSGALKQEEYRASFLPAAVRSDAPGLEYDFRLLLLPEHPYNLEVYANRFEPLVKEQSATHLNSLETSRGIDFHFRRVPYSAHAGWAEDTLESGATTSHVSRGDFDGLYSRQYGGNDQFFLDAAVSPTRASSSDGLRGESLTAALGNLIEFGRYRLSSNVSKSTLEQTGLASGRFDSDQLAWEERFTLTFTPRLRTDAFYRYQDIETRFPEASDPGVRDLQSHVRELQLDVVHRLFESLDSAYTFIRNEQSSTSGDTVSTSHTLSESYSKQVPNGRLLVGLGLARSETTSAGQGEVVEEPHLAVAVPGSFRLGQNLADPNTITVFLRSPLAPFEVVPLVENVDYVVVPIANTFEIDLLTLPSQFAVPGTYDFRVTYLLSFGGFRLRSDTFSNNASLELFDNLVMPYYSYVAVRSDVEGGSFPVGAFDTTTITAGVAFHRGPVRAHVQFQDVRWELNPYQVWTGDVQYVGTLGPTTSLYTSLGYTARTYANGSSLVGGASTVTGGYRDEAETAAATLQQQLFARSLSLSVGGTVSRNQGRYGSSSASFTASLSWTKGKLSLSAGASGSNSDVSGTQFLSSSRDHRYYYLRLQRRLY